jgi:hypothetical protein
MPPEAVNEPPVLVKLPPALPAQLALVHTVLPSSRAPPAVAAAMKLPSLRATMDPAAARLLLPVVL